MLRLLVNHQPSKKYIRVLQFGWLILMVVFFLGLKTVFDKTMISIPLIVNIIIDQFGVYIVFFEICRSLYYSKNIPDSVKKVYTRTFLVVFGAIWFSVILIGQILLFGYLDANKVNLFVSFLYIIFNLLPLILLKSFVNNVYGTIDENPIFLKKYECPEDVFKRHDITPREQEIIKLVCEGKTNQKIANELCISIHTVKDHNYRIFKKLDVTNRVHLVNMFKNI